MPPAITCECGACPKCKRRQYMRDYYRRPGVADRVRAHARSYRERELDKVRAKDRARGFRVYDVLKVEARRAVRLAKLERQPCEVCGTHEQIEAHHEDYSKPLDVRWLCKTHHMQLHRSVAA